MITPLETSSEDMKALHLTTANAQEEYAIPCHFSFAPGNHEGESGYWLDQTPQNIRVFGTLWRKFYYPNPAPNHFIREI